MVGSGEGGGDMIEDAGDAAEDGLPGELVVGPDMTSG